MRCGVEVSTGEGRDEEGGCAQREGFVDVGGEVGGVGGDGYVGVWLLVIVSELFWGAGLVVGFVEGVGTGYGIAFVLVYGMNGCTCVVVSLCG